MFYIYLKEINFHTDYHWRIFCRGSVIFKYLAWTNFCIYAIIFHDFSTVKKKREKSEKKVCYQFAPWGNLFYIWSFRKARSFRKATENIINLMTSKPKYDRQSHFLQVIWFICLFLYFVCFVIRIWLIAALYCWFRELSNIEKCFTELTKGNSPQPSTFSTF